MAAPVEQVKSVSVIIPCYNCSRYLPQTLNSLLEQTCKDFQVICVNDGSTDDTPELLRRWQEAGELDLKIIHQENGGVSRARNTGIEAAQSEFILFLDGDDCYHREYVELMLRSVRESGADTVYCPLVRDMDKLAEVKPEPENFRRHTQKEIMDNLMLRMGSYGFYCYLYRREVLMNEGIRFTPGVRYFEDREFNWKYLCHCQSAVWLAAPLYGYRKVEGSVMSGKMTWERAEGGLNGIRQIEAYMEKTHCPYLDTFRDYLPHRLMWTTLKNCATHSERQMYDCLIREKDVAASMKRMRRDHSFYVSLTARLYGISPGLMYHALRLAGRML